MSARQIIIDLFLNEKKFSDSADKSLQVLDRFDQKTAAFGQKMTKTMTPAFAAFGAASAAAFNEYDKGSDSIIAKTGATGDKLKGLESVMKGVAGNVNADFGLIGDKVGELNASLGITGKPLAELTTQLVELDKLGQTFDTTSFTRFLGDWSVPADQASSALDRLYKLSQVTGVGMGRLQEIVVQYGAPLRALGFDMDEATTMLAKWDKEGVNTEAVLAGMKSGLGRTAKAMNDGGAAANAAELAQAKYNAVVDEYGAESQEAETAAIKLEEANKKAAKTAAESIPQAFNQTIAAIKGAATEGEAFGLAIDAFGQKAGPDLARAVIEGRFEIDELWDSVGKTTGSINKAYKATLDWSDKLGMWKNKAVAVLGPMGEMGMAIGGIGAAIGPVITVGGKLMGLFATKAVAATAAAAATTGLATAEAAEGVVAGVATLPTMSFAAAIWAVAAPVLAVVAVIGLLVAAGYLLIKNFDEVKAGASILWQRLQAGWDGFLAGVQRVWQMIQAGWDDVLGFFGKIPGWIGDAMAGVANLMTLPFRTAFNAIADLWNNTIGRLSFKFPSWVPGLGGKGFDVPDIPNLQSFHTGGIVPGVPGSNVPILAQAGERVLSRADAAHGGTGSPIIIQAGAIVGSEQELMKYIEEGLARRKRGG